MGSPVTTIGTPRRGYVAFSVQVTTTATSLLALALTQLGLKLPGACRELQIQVDPEVAPGGTVRIGDGSLGTTVGGFVQKGVSLIAGTSSDTWRGSGANNCYPGSMYLQTTAGTAIVNVQFLDY
jgi:hypothetical protein